MRSLFSSFIPISMVLASLVNADVITANKQLEELISAPTILSRGAAGIATNNSGDALLDLTLDASGTTVNSFGTKTGEAYGLYAVGKTQIIGTQGKNLVFKTIFAQSSSVYGIKASDLTLDGVTLAFESLSKTQTQNSGVDVRGIDSQNSSGLNLTLINDASIYFRSINSDKDLDYPVGIATGFGGVSSNIDISQGSLSFDLIQGVERTTGILFQATTNSLNGDIIFSHIESTGKPTATNPRDAYGVSFSPSASATLQENSRIYIVSMASNGGNYPVFAQQALSLTFEKNAGIIYGVITEDEKANSYGIYAKTDKTLGYVFGAGGQQGVTPANAKGTIFKSIESVGNKNSYGIYLYTTNQAKTNINGMAVFKDIHAISGNAYGFYIIGEGSLQGIGGEKNLTFANITSQNGEVAGLAIAQDSFLSLGGGLKLTFEGIDAGKYAIKNQGKFVINQSGLLSFGTLQVASYAIGNTLENLVYELGETEVGDGSAAVAVQYGFYNTATQTKLNGSLSVKKFTSSSPFSLIYDGGASAGAIEIDNLSFLLTGIKQIQIF